MQFVDGTYADAALRAGTMAPHRAVHIIAEVAKALDFAHAHHVPGIRPVYEARAPHWMCP